MATSEKDLARELIRKQKVIEDLLVVIDTAQAALRRAESTLKKEEDLKYVMNQSARWVLTYKLD